MNPSKTKTKNQQKWPWNIEIEDNNSLPALMPDDGDFPSSLCHFLSSRSSVSYGYDPQFILFLELASMVSIFAFK